MGIDQHGSADSPDYRPPEDPGSTYRLPEEIQAEQDATRGIIYIEGTGLVIFELERPQGEVWPVEVNNDEVYHSLNIFSDRTGLSLNNIKIMRNANRASFTARLPLDTCSQLIDQGYIDLFYTSDRGNGTECVDYLVHATNAKGHKRDDPARDAYNAQRAAEREEARARRMALLLTFNYNLGKDLLMLDSSSGIFNTIKQKILYTAEVVFGNHPNTAPQHMNLIDVKTDEGADAHAFRLYVVLNPNFYGKIAKLHASFDLSPLKHFWGIDQLINGRMPKLQLDRIAASQCCYRHNDPTSDSTTFNCPAAGNGTCNLRSQAISYFLTQEGSSSSDASVPFRGFAASKKRKREEKQQELKAAAEAQRANIRVKICKRWEDEGACRHLTFLGYRRCARDHPDEESRTRNIECCSSSARPKPKRCYLMDRCPYRNHNQSI